MNENIQTLLNDGILVGGKITKQDGFVVFSRMSNEELATVNDDELAFATKSMGRGIFSFGKNGEVVNYKGVDSHLLNEELITLKLVNGQTFYITEPGKNYMDSMFPINLIVFPGNRPEIRLRGLSPLEDLEEEAEVNAKMQGNEIKIPRLTQVREFTQDFLTTYGLPVKVDGDYEELASKCKYRYRNEERKEFLRKTYGETYMEDVEEGKRPQRLTEYLSGIDISQIPGLEEFLAQSGIEFENFGRKIDEAYSLGQRYGQTIRIVQNPFRVSDLEYYTRQKNIPAIESIVAFSQSVQENPEESMETYFAKQMGINLGNMMNTGWMCTNYGHRQDYSLAGEMCDDSYQLLPEQLMKAKYSKKSPETETKYAKRRFFYQIYALSANIKVLQDEMKLRGKSSYDIEKVLDDFLTSFVETLDLQKVQSHIGIDPIQVFQQVLAPNQNYERILAAEMERPNQPIIFNPEVLEGQKGNKEFFEKMNSRLALKLNIERTFGNQTVNAHTLPECPGE